MWANPVRLFLDGSNLHNLDFMKTGSHDKLKTLKVENNWGLTNIDGVRNAVNLREYHGMKTGNRSALDVFNNSPYLEDLRISYNWISSSGE